MKKDYLLFQHQLIQLFAEDLLTRRHCGKAYIFTTNTEPIKGRVHQDVWKKMIVSP
jgi:hypothetical protein